jgi:hypothetical protein
MTHPHPTFRRQDLADLLIEHGARLPRRRLRRHLRRGPIEVGVFTDEEMWFVVDDPDAVPLATVDAPRLGVLAPAERDLALETSLWQLIARGEMVRTGDGPALTGVLAVLSELRAAANAAGTVRVTARDGDERVTTLVVVDRELVILDDVDPSGLHHVVLLSPRDAAATLAQHVDPAGRATHDGPVRRAATSAHLAVHLDPIVADADTTAVLHLATREAASPDAPATSPLPDPGSGAGTAPLREAALTIHAGRGGVHLLHGQEDVPDGVAVARVGPDQLHASLHTHLLL